jgi:hypothetical protein
MSVDVPGHPGVRRSRRRLQAEVFIEAQGCRRALELLDVSLSGARLRSPGEWDAQHVGVQLELQVGDEDPVRIAASVVREREGEIALRFAQLSPSLAERLGALLEREGRLLQEIEARE